MLTRRAATAHIQPLALFVNTGNHCKSLKENSSDFYSHVKLVFEEESSYFPLCVLL
jgi:hypothetical protein